MEFFTFVCKLLHLLISAECNLLYLQLHSLQSSYCIVTLNKKVFCKQDDNDGEPLPRRPQSSAGHLQTSTFSRYCRQTSTQPDCCRAVLNIYTRVRSVGIVYRQTDRQTHTNRYGHHIKHIHVNISASMWHSIKILMSNHIIETCFYMAAILKIQYGRHVLLFKMVQLYSLTLKMYD